MRDISLRTITWTRRHTAAGLFISMMALSLSACAPSTHIVRKPTNVPILVEGINVLFVNSSMVSQGKAPDKITNKELSSPFAGSEALRDAVVAKLPQLFLEKGINALGASTNPVPGVPSAPLKDLFPKTFHSHHLLVILPMSASTSCYYSICNTFYNVSLSLRTPVENKELALTYLVQEPFNRVKDFDEFIGVMASNVLSIVSAKNALESDKK